MRKLTKDVLKAVYPVPIDLEAKMRSFLNEVFASRTKPQRIRDTMMERIKKDE